MRTDELVRVTEANGCGGGAGHLFQDIAVLRANC